MRVGLNLRSKMLIFTFGIVAVLMGLSYAVIHRFVVEQVQGRVVEDLKKTREVFKKFMQERALWLRSQCWVVAEDPRFTAMLDIQDPNLEFQARTVLREAKKFQGIIGSDLFIVTDRAGRTLARIEASASAEEDLRGMPTIGRALGGEPATGTWVLGGVEYHVATVPIREGERLAGTLSAGLAVAEGEAGALMGDLLKAARGERFQKALQSGDVEGTAAAVRELQVALGADLVAVTDGVGRAAGLTICTTGYGEDLSALQRLQDALNGHESMGLQVDHGRMVHLVVVPVWSQGQIVGTLSTGFEIDDRLAGDLREMMHTEVSFALDSRVVASTWTGAVRRDLERTISVDWDAQGRRASPFEMAVGPETYLTLRGELEGVEGGGMGIYLIQLSLDQAVAFLNTIENVLLMIGGGVLVAAGLISFLGVAQIVKPVKALVEGTRRLAAGDLAHQIPAASRDEIGELAGSFNVMSAALTRSRDALAESESRYRDLFENAQDFVFTTDLDMRFTSINKAGLDMLGCKMDDVIGKMFCDFLSPEDATRLRDLNRQHPHAGSRPEFEVDLLGKKGIRVTVEVATRWIIDAGSVVGIHGIARDITERREREHATSRFREQLHQAEKLRALGEMAAGVAHNFNNLLAGVLGYAQLIELGDAVPSPILKNVRKIIQAAQRCSSIIKRIQTFGRPIDITRREPVSLHEVIRETVEITQPKWKVGPEREGRAVHVESDLGDIPPVESSWAVWEEILSNLIFNAVDAMPRGGTIRISTWREGDEVVLSVADTGTGMDEETKRRIFEPFFTTKKPELGTGLGLSTVWGLLQGLEGKIDIQSTPGQGSAFTIRVPVAPGAVRLTEEREVHKTITGLRILVIDDEPSVRDILPQMLEGHSVDKADGGTEGLERLRQETYDIVISDWTMPEVSGLDVALEVKRLSPETVMVLMSGWEVNSRPADRDPAVDLVLQKPFMMDDVRRIVAQAVEIRKGLATNIR